MRTDLVVINFGGPKHAEEVEPFLRALFDDPDVIQFPLGRKLQGVFADTMAERRARIVGEHYAHIGFSPLVDATLEQVEALRTTLGDDAPKIHVGMRYTAPTIESVVEAIAADPPDRIVAIATYPHYSDTTTGSSFNAFAAAMNAHDLARLPVHYVPAFYDHPRYVNAMVDRIEAAAQTVPDGVDAHLLFSAHGLPSSYARDGGDPYPEQIQDSVRMIMRQLNWPSTWGLAYQSRVGPVRWLKPSTDAELLRLADEGVEHAVVVPISFTTEGIETLQEIDVQFAELAAAKGLRLHRAATVDTHPEFIGCLADVVLRAVADTSHGGLGAHRCIRCLLPKPHAHRTRIDCLDCGHRTPEYLLRLPPPR